MRAPQHGRHRRLRAHRMVAGLCRRRPGVARSRDRPAFGGAGIGCHPWGRRCDGWPRGPARSPPVTPSVTPYQPLKSRLFLSDAIRAQVPALLTCEARSPDGCGHARRPGSCNLQPCDLEQQLQLAMPGSRRSAHQSAQLSSPSHPQCGGKPLRERAHAGRRTAAAPHAGSNTTDIVYFIFKRNVGPCFKLAQFTSGPKLP